jgi:transcriptional regulator with XRE-family HTH domain
VPFRQYRTYPWRNDPRVAQLGEKMRERKSGGEVHIVSSLSAASGVSNGAIRKILSGKTRMPYNRTVAALGIALDFTEEEWMLYLRRAAPRAVPLRKTARN